MDGSLKSRILGTLKRTVLFQGERNVKTRARCGGKEDGAQLGVTFVLCCVVKIGPGAEREEKTDELDK